MSKTHLQTSHSNWAKTKAMIESLNAEDLLDAAKKAELYEPITDSRIKEFLKMISRIGATAPGSDEKKSYLLAQLKSSMVYHGCPLIFFTINPGERHSPIALLYAGEEIDIQQFDPQKYTSSDRLKTMLRNPLAVVEYSEINGIKSIVRTVPNFQERGYRWPFEGTDAKFTSKDNLEDAYDEIWDGRDIDIHDIDSRTPLTIDDLEEGSKVFVEYTISPYSAKKPRPNVEGFEAGTTLRLLSIGLLERPDRRSNFESPRKRRRMAA
jgi:hypothetical protein